MLHATEMSTGADRTPSSATRYSHVEEMPDSGEICAASCSLVVPVLAKSVAPFSICKDGSLEVVRVTRNDSKPYPFRAHEEKDVTGKCHCC